MPQDFNMKKNSFGIDSIKRYMNEKLSRISSDALGWIAVLILHSATIPSLLAVMSGLTDKLPGVDLVLLLWTGLAFLFIKAAVQKDMLNLITIGFGFIIQAMMMMLIFFS
jgi:hypothetical protein